MRALEADNSAANSPAAMAQRTKQATNALLPRAFDCVRLLYANEPRAKPMRQVCCWVRLHSTRRSRPTATASTSPAAGGGGT